MNRGLIIKGLRETLAGTLLFAAGLGVVEGLLAYAVPALFSEHAEQLLQLQFVQRVIGALLGTEIGQTFGPDMIQSFAWVHPIALAVIWGHAIWFCSRVPSGEIDHGTIDWLLALPVSRLSVLAHDTAVLIVSGAIVVTFGWIGNVLGNRLADTTVRGSLIVFIGVALNLFCMHLCVGGMVCALSAVSHRRGRAVGGAAALVLGSFLLSFLAQVWQPARSIDFLSVLTYYRPLEVVRDAAWPMGNMAVLIGVGAGLWLCAAVMFDRRDIRVA